MDILTSITSLKESIKSTSNLQTIKDSLSNAAKLLLSSSSSSSSPSSDGLWEQAYVKFVTFLLDNVFVDWVSCFTSKENTALFDIFFLQSPSPTTTLLALTSYTFSPKESDQPENGYVLEYIEDVVTRYYVQKDYIGKLITEGIKLELNNQPSSSGSSIHKLSNKWDSIITLIGSLPERFNNKLQGKASEILLPEQLMEVIVEQAKGNPPAALVGITAQVLALFFGKMAKLGHANILARELLVICVNSNKKEKELVKKTLDCIPSGSLESIFEAILRNSPSRFSQDSFVDVFSDIFGEMFLGNETFSFLLSKFLTHKVFPKRPLFYLLNLILELSIRKSGELTKESFAVKCAVSLLAMWSDKNFLHHTSVRQHRQITRAIQFFISKTNKDLLQDVLIPYLVKGVQHHMQSPQRYIRVYGMKTAEVFSVVLDPEKPLKFDEDLNENASDDEGKDPQPPTPLPSNATPASITSLPSDSSAEDEVETKRETRKKLDPNEIVSFEDDDSEDDLVPYDLNDDESDLHPHAKQYYLRDCLAIFQQPSDKLDFDKFKGAITSIERIVRTKPDDLDEVSELLAKTLLRSRNEFAEEDYAEHRKASLVALAVNSPTIVVGFLGKQFYEQNYSIAQRMLMLDVLIDAAKELSAITPVPEPKIQTPSDLHMIGKVIRKGTTQPKQQHAQSIPFYSLANLFVYPLMAKYDNKENSFNLLGEDSMVLGRLVYALGTFMRCAGNSPSARSISVDLVNFLWAIRLHKEPTVRQAVLFALVAVVEVIPQYMLVEDFQDTLDDIRTLFGGNRLTY